ncbi:MAG: response regulator [Desulfobacterales bacterium]|nr:response regulator [Desulfobacterales bacterium]
MAESSDSTSDLRKLQDRAKYIEEVNRWTMDALDLLVSFGDFQANLNPDQDPATIFRLARQHLKRLIPFRTLAFLMVSESDLEFVLADCEPESDRTLIQQEVDIRIEEGTFAWALQQNRAVTVPAERVGHALVLHPMGTRSRVLGMFVGVLGGVEPTITSIASNMLTAILFNTAHALENSALYEKINEQNRNLEDLVKKRTEELRKALEAAEAANITKSQFLANMSHEIRTPLNAIVGFAGMALKQDLSPKLRNYMDTVETSAQILLGIIKDILDLSKIDAGKLDMETIDFQLRDVLENLSAVFHDEAVEKGIKMAISLAEDVPCELIGDPLRLGQILMNLTSNAIKFTEKGEIIIKVVCAEKSPDKAVLEFSVKDTGIGIPRESIAKLFTPFTQADGSTTRRYGGTGLGLTICKRLVDMMDGEIRAKSEPGQGSAFYFTANFGRQSEDKEKRPVASSVSTEPVTIERLRGATILVAEDNTINQDVASEILASVGIIVETANNGKEAIDALNSGAYDCVLMDIQMPDMDGFEATRLIRQDPNFNKLPIIAMTAHAMTGDRQKCIEVGMNDYIAKPIEPEELFSKLGKWVVR